MWMASAAERERDRVEFLRKHEEAMWEALRSYQTSNNKFPVARAPLPTQGADATRQVDRPPWDQSGLRNTTVAKKLNPAAVAEWEDERAEFVRKHEEAMWETLRPYRKGNHVAQAVGAPAHVQGVDALLESKRAEKEQCVRKDAGAGTRLRTQEVPVMKASFESKLSSPEASDEVSRRVTAAALQKLKEEKANKCQALFETPAGFDPAVAKLQVTPQRPPFEGPLTGRLPAEARSAPTITREVCAAKPALQRRRRYIAPGSSTKTKQTKLLDTVKEESECDLLEEDTGA